MGVFKTFAIVFVAGWALWLWMDKSPAPSPYYPGFAGAPQARGLPPASGESGIVQELQWGMNLVKAGEFRQAFVTLWRDKSWLVAGIVTALLLMVGPGLGRLFARRPRWPRQRSADDA